MDRNLSVYGFTPDEVARLDELEGIVSRGLETFYEVGCALREIRDSRLYRERGYKTFEDYCKGQWHIDKRYANYQIAAASTVENIQNGNNCSQIPKSESVIRPLTKLSPEQQVSAWEKVLATGEKVTAKSVQKVVDEFKPPKKKTTTDEPRVVEQVNPEPVEKLTLSTGELVSAEDVEHMKSELKALRKERDQYKRDWELLNNQMNNAEIQKLKEIKNLSDEMPTQETEGETK